ncbi:prolyl oligopeptidase family serine peptidase [Gammaproteobacteria bacterium]|nr:prolyl oligopeptidase family serine peptidase [Gammaproteobacteria bacterium]
MKKTFLLLILINTSCTTMTDNKPEAKKIPITLTAHNDSRVDNYYWLRDDSRSDVEMLNYLKEENLYKDKWFKENKPYTALLIEEYVSQLPKEEVSYPKANGNFNYFTKITNNEQLKRIYRSSNKNEELLYDPNIKLNNQEYYDIYGVFPSNDNKLLALSEDNNGRRVYSIKFLDPVTKTFNEQVIEGSSGKVVWSKDNKYIYYIKKDTTTLIANSVYRHKVGSKVSNDTLLYKEADESFELTLSRSSDKNLLYININATDNNEIRILNLDTPLKSPEIFIAREEDHLYYLEHTGDNSFLVLSNKNAPNFKILKSISINNRDIDSMETVVSHSNDIFINNILLINNTLIQEVRANGLPEIYLFNLSSKETIQLPFEDNAYDVWIDQNHSDTKNLFYNYTSLLRPQVIYKLDIDNLKSDIVWEKEVVGFSRDAYQDNRFFITARDGEQIPVITVSKKGIDYKKSPILFYGYGSYGINIDATFRQSIIPLLDKGFIFSILNIRGGGEMGKSWYEDGRMMNKMNTFYDFNDSVKAVLNKGIGDPENVFARGGSAGGLLMGAIINLEPELYKGILSGVPFVDVLTTMSDATIPLTTFEYGEWGNPAVKEQYEYMKQYSPYDNIDYKNYPAIFITSSLYDSQVQYFEPAKYIAKIREYNQSNNPILMDMNLIGGHGGMSGQINQFNEIAEEFNFILNLAEKN